MTQLKKQKPINEMTNYEFYEKYDLLPLAKKFSKLADRAANISIELTACQKSLENVANLDQQKAPITREEYVNIYRVYQGILLLSSSKLANFFGIKYRLKEQAMFKQIRKSDKLSTDELESLLSEKLTESEGRITVLQALESIAKEHEIDLED